MTSSKNLPRFLSAFAGCKNPTAKIVQITPEDAQLALDSYSGIRNRSLNQSRVLRYAGDMTAGNWQLNGETLIFSRDGHLMNGQHRMHACVKAGVTISSFVVFGIDSSLMSTIDQGCSRRISHALEIEGFENGGSLSSTLKFINMIRESTCSASRAAPTTAAAKEMLALEPGIEEVVNEMAEWCRTVGICGSGVAEAIVYLSSRRPEALTFMKKVLTGEGLFMDDDHPSHEQTARRALLGLRKYRNKAELQRYILVSCWNRHCQREDVRVLRQPTSFRGYSWPMPQ